MTIYSTARKGNSFQMILLVFAGIFFGSGLEAQQNVNTQGWWLIYIGDNKINDKIGIHSEVQLRNHFVNDALETSFFRVGMHYYTSRSSMATLGYGYFYSEPSSAEMPLTISREHRSWQQFLTRHKTQKLFMEHRYRLEQRFVSFADDTPDLMDHRIRYRFQAIFPFYTLSPRLRHYFLAGYNEVMLNFRENHAEVFDRNRLYFALGYQVSPKLNFQLGYLNQVARQGGFPNLEHNHLLQVSAFYNMDDLMRTFFRAPIQPQ